MRNQKCKNKDLQKLLETHSKKMINVRKEKKNIKDNLRSNGLTKRGVIKEFSQMVQTIEKW